jgi:hypothetical protein
VSLTLRTVTDLQRFETRTKLELGLSMFVLAPDGHLPCSG